MIKIFDIRIKQITVTRAVESIICAVIGAVVGTMLTKIFETPYLIQLCAFFVGAFVSLRIQSWILNYRDSKYNSNTEQICNDQ